MGDEFHPLHHVPQARAGTDDVLVHVLLAEPREQRLPIGLRGLPQRFQLVEAAIVLERHGQRLEQLPKRGAMAGREGNAGLGYHDEHAGRLLVGTQGAGEQVPHDAGR